jgi:hypothetical protein
MYAVLVVCTTRVQYLVLGTRSSISIIQYGVLYYEYSICTSSKSSYNLLHKPTDQFIYAELQRHNGVSRVYYKQCSRYHTGTGVPVILGTAAGNVLRRNRDNVTRVRCGSSFRPTEVSMSGNLTLEYNCNPKRQRRCESNGENGTATL